MSQKTFDLVIRNGEVATGFGLIRADIGVCGGKVAAIGEALPSGTNEIDASNLIITPGGVDSHCHIEEFDQDGSRMEESFASGSAAALAGGTTSFICFLPQWKGHSLKDSAPGYEAAARRSRADYSFHQVITDPTPDVLMKELPDVVARGVRSIKVFLTYDNFQLTDQEFIDVLVAAKQLGVLVTVHCESYAAIGWMTKKLIEEGHTDPIYHAVSRPPVVEREATSRAIALAQLVGQPLQIFHVSCDEVAGEVARAQARGGKVWAETCPQYLTLSHDDLLKADFEGAKYVCSPPVRQRGETELVWANIRSGTLDIVTSDHCGYSFETAKRNPKAGAYGQGKQVVRKDGMPAFNRIPNGVPGIETRMPVVFSEGVSAGRIDIQTFVRITSANAARLFGLQGKGSLLPGADADIVLWDPRAERKVENVALHHAIDYTPWEGTKIRGWPVMTILRGNIAVREGEVLAAPGDGRFIARGAYDLASIPCGSR